MEARETPKPWNCPRCHTPLGFTVRRKGGKRNLLIFEQNSPRVLAEISGDTRVYCTQPGCAGHRDWHWWPPDCADCPQ